MTTTTETTNPAGTGRVVPPVRVAVDELASTMNKAMNSLSGTFRKHTTIEAPLVELVRLRASQINGCVYCVDLHSTDAIAAGDTQRRVNAMTVWRESPFFTARERAAFALTEAGARISQGEVSDEVLDEARAHFTGEELAQLIFHIAEINAWNTIGAIARPWPIG
jgi:AhpD family alkylhydroperoxidase